MHTVCPLIFISHHGEIVGGGELSLLDLLFGLDRSRWEPHVVVPAEGELSRRCRRQGVTTHIIPLPQLRLPSVGTGASLFE